MNLTDIQFIISIATLLGIVYAVYRTFRDPDIKADKSISLLKEQLAYEKTTASLAIQTNQNCIHSLQGEVNDMKNDIGTLNVSIGKLETIINERIPKKL
jgi:hypothetical protein